MKVSNCKIKDCLIIDPQVYGDSRGKIVCTYLKNKINDLIFVEEVFTYSKQNVLRGFHGDFRTWKLVQCVYGTVFIVIVDVRKDSETFLQKESFIINDKNKNQILIPSGCVNGWLTTSKKSIFQYRKSEYYDGNEVFIPYNNDIINAKWPVDNPILSQKDKKLDFELDLLKKS
tara:strand:- start:1722 stop:2240 length:519 start_codon:yes stop_codon:yes gene_type:complete